MTDENFATLRNEYSLIYVYTINDSAHKDAIKIGKAVVRTPLPPDAVASNCDLLNKAACARIDQETKTAAVKYELLYTELAPYSISVNGKPQYHNPPQLFDKVIHKILSHSGIKVYHPNGINAQEWFKTDLKTVKNAINAYREGRLTLNAAEVVSPRKRFEPREEQIDAIERTLKRFKKKNDMLWDAKMRFGKTCTALEVVRRTGYRKTIIATHRPVVKGGWQEDFNKIFSGDDALRYSYLYKNDTADPQGDFLRAYVDRGDAFIYFASIQDLRGSRIAGGSFDKNRAVFELDWDLLIVDEAHEGTTTDLGEMVLSKLAKPDTKVLKLSGTPFNIIDDFEDEAVYSWDYIQEQTAKRDWDKKHPDKPNPYASLPKMNMRTFNLGSLIEGFGEVSIEDKSFNFAEFFRVKTSSERCPLSERNIPPGRFIYEADVRRFLDLISTTNNAKQFPYATEANRRLFKHTFWLVPGVKEGAALCELLRKHKVFGSSAFGIVNVAGEGDSESDYNTALDEVRNAIKKYEYTITVSCGKLTTGVTVPEWTAVLMLSGSYMVSAAQYLQTMFRCQSPGVIDGRQKENCYVFDFAPDRALRVFAEAAEKSRRGRTGDDGEREQLGELLNFCPIIAMDGTNVTEYSAADMLEQIKRVRIQRAIKNGFDDTSIYKKAALSNMSPKDLEFFNRLHGILGKTKQTVPPKAVVIADTRMTQEEREKLKRAEQKKKEKRELTKEERELLEKKRIEEKNRQNAISIIRSVSIRLPMMIYGADFPFEEDIRLRDFAQIVDEISWTEFMPHGFTKKMFLDTLKFYDEDVIIGAGHNIRRMVKQADSLPPAKRVMKIAEVQSYFKNPSKETVLTPWRVVNMHMGDTLGGWDFFKKGTNRTEVADAPWFNNVEGVTDRTLNNCDAKILEINSKTGLYPLYVAYSLFRASCKELEEFDMTPKQQGEIWEMVLRENLFVICNSPMAVSITKRTLAGYKQIDCNVHYEKNLVQQLENPARTARLVSRIINTNGKGIWNRRFKDMKFSAIVGNPPYQLVTAVKETENGQKSVRNIFQYFQQLADGIDSGVSSLIYPGGRWIHRSGKGLEEFGAMQINDPHLKKLIFYPDSEKVFSGIGIADGLSIVLKDYTKTSCGFEYVYDQRVQKYQLANPGQELMILNPDDANIVNLLAKIVEEKKLKYLHDSILSRNLFGIESNFVECHPDKVRPYVRGKRFDETTEVCVLTNDRAGKAGRAKWFIIKRDEITTGKEFIGQWKVVVSSANAGGQKRDNQLEIIDNRSVFGRVKVALKIFKTKIEAENFYKYAKSYLVRYSLLMTDEALTSLAKRTPDILDYTNNNGFIDFTGDINAQLYDLFELSQSDQRYIESVVNELDNRRGKV